MCIVGIDIGTRTTVGCTKDKCCNIESRYEEKIELDSMNKDDDFFEVDGKEYKISSGTYQNNIFKYKKRNFKYLLWYTLAKLVKSQSRAKICFGIPVDQFNNKDIKKEMATVIRGNSEFTIKIGNQNKTIYIEDFIIRPEGYGIYRNARKQKLLDESAQTILIDIGGKTTDITLYSTTGKLVDGWSLPYGLTMYYEKVKDLLISKGASDTTVEQAEEYCYGRENDWKPRTLPHGLNLTIEKEIFEEHLYNDLLAKFDNPNNYNVIVAGGGANFWDTHFKSLIPDVIIDKDVESNGKSFYQLAREHYEERN